MQPLLTIPIEPAAFELVNATGQSDVVLVCDHASNRVPLQLQNLGLTSQQLNTHIAWDIGALGVARCLSALLDAPLILSNYSRLVVDCNRIPERSDSIPVSSDGVLIPGNQNIAEQETVSRRQALFDPYHAAIDRLLSARADRATFLLSIHSFTPIFEGVERAWPIGVCYEEESLWARRWHTSLQAHLTAPVGDNEPYQIEADVDFTLPNHGSKHGIPAIMLEIRQDEICDQAAVEKWGEIIQKSWLQCCR